MAATRFADRSDGPRRGELMPSATAEGMFRSGIETLAITMMALPNVANATIVDAEGRMRSGYMTLAPVPL